MTPHGPNDVTAQPVRRGPVCPLFVAGPAGDARAPETDPYRTLAVLVNGGYGLRLQALCGADQLPAALQLAGQSAVGRNQEHALPVDGYRHECVACLGQPLIARLKPACAGRP